MSSKSLGHPNPNPIPVSMSSSSCILQIQPLGPPNPNLGPSKPWVPQLQPLYPPNPASVSLKSNPSLPNSSPKSLQALGPSTLQKMNPPHNGNQSPPDNSQMVFLVHPSEQREEGAGESRMGVEFTMQRDPSSAGLPLLTPLCFLEQPKEFQVLPHFFLRILGFFTGRR